MPVYDNVAASTGHKIHSRKAHRSMRNAEFIAWDGEGIAVNEPQSYGYGMLHAGPDREPIFDYKPDPQPYVLFANSKTGHIINPEGLTTRECFEFLLDTKQQYPHSVFVGFGLNYDVNQWLRSLPKENLWKLHDTNQTHIGGYFIKWYPRKSFYVKHGRTHRSAIIYDVFGFFQASFLAVCQKYLGTDDPDLELIQEGKAAREAFQLDELDKFIIPYNRMELDMLVQVMDIFRKDLTRINIYPSKWHGPGAVAADALKLYGVKVSRTIPEEILDASQYAYAGGRFEQFFVGRYAGSVYEYDIHSAYPEAASQLPDLTAGHWKHCESFQPGTFGVWRIEYRSPDGDASYEHPPQPLFCRSRDGNISYPCEASGWYWTPEASLVPDSVREGYVFSPDTERRPFKFVEQLYHERRVFKDAGNSSERAVKLVLNSLYGKLAQTVGGEKGPPSYHQLEWAGYITSYTRAKLYRAMMQAPHSIIACETDAVFSTEPLDLDEGNGLGQWEKIEYDWIVYLQSGFYYAGQGTHVVCKYRGMDRDRATMQPTGLPLGIVLDHLANRTGQRGTWITPPLHSHTTRFIGLGLGLRTDAVWRSWQKDAKIVALDQEPWISKRSHIRQSCPVCEHGYSMYDRLHPLIITGYSGNSYARVLPWRQRIKETAPLAELEWLEMDPDLRDFSEDMYRWQ